MMAAALPRPRPVARLVFAAVGLLVFLASARPGQAAPVAGAAGGADDSLFREVQVVYGASRQAIRSVSLRYTFDWDGIHRDAARARDGDKEYDASIERNGRMLSMPQESAWDGSRAYARRVDGKLDVSSDRSITRPANPAPLAMLGNYIHVALGFEPAEYGQVYAFRGSRVVDGHLVELTFDAPFVGAGGKLVSLHDRDLDCWPTRVTLFWDDGTFHYDAKQIDYEVRTIDGNRVICPVQYLATIRDKADNSSDTSFKVEAGSLKLNEPIPASRFVLTPWPSEQVFDWDSKKMTPAADPEWVAAGNVEFPFDEWARRSAVASAAGRSDDSPKKQAASAEALARLDPPASSRWWLLVLAGGLAVAAWAVVALRSRGTSRRATGRQGFTLVELLVVIGIVGLLLAVLLPVLGSVRRTGQTTRCLSQVREVGRHMALYANDNRDTLYPMEALRSFPPRNGRSQATVLEQLVSEDLWDDLLLCPTADPSREFLSYVLNARTSYNQKRANSSGGKIGASEMIVAAENVPGSNADFGSDTDSYSSLVNYDLARHASAGSSYLWLDLHASTRSLTRDELVWHLQVYQTR